MFKLLYNTFLVCTSLFVLQDYGIIFSLRQLSAILLFAYCILTYKTLWCDALLKVYFYFIFCFAISSIFSGYTLQFINRLFGDYFVAYVAYSSTVVMCKHYKDPKSCIRTFTYLGIFASIVTIFQLLHINYLDSFLAKFQLVQDQMQINRMGSDLELVGRAISGVFSTPVDNGHKLAAFLFLSLGFTQNKFINYFCTIVIYIGLFCVQVRTPFYAATLLLVIYFVKQILSINSKVKYFIIICLFVVLLLATTIIYDFLVNGEFRYALGSDLTGRNFIWENCINFIVLHPLFGGLFDYLAVYEQMPHNILLNSLIYSGIIGTISIIVIIGYLIKKVIILIFKNKHLYSLIYSLAFLSVFLDSITHNIQVVNGDVLFWIFAGYIIYGYKYRLYD